MAERRLVGVHWITKNKDEIIRRIIEGQSAALIYDYFLEMKDRPPLKERMFRRHVAKIRAELKVETNPLPAEAEPEKPVGTEADLEPLKVGSNYSFGAQVRSGEDKTLDELVHGVNK